MANPVTATARDSVRVCWRLALSYGCTAALIPGREPDGSERVTTHHSIRKAGFFHFAPDTAVR